MSAHSGSDFMQVRTNILYHPKFKQILLIVAAFLFAQFSASTHAHDLHTDADEAPDHQICSVCLIATESGDDAQLDNDDKDGEAIKLLFGSMYNIPVEVTGPQLVCRTEPEPQHTVQPYLLSRAPPLKRQSII